MLALLSPAKALDFSSPPPTLAELPPTTPALIDQAQMLMRSCRGLTQKKIIELMKLSPELAKLNYDRYRSFELPFSRDNALACAFAFNGDVYRGLDARSLGADDLEFAQHRIGILSGLFGLLRPLDLIQAYRLEMGTRLKTRRGSNLYQFWGDTLQRRIEATVAEHEDSSVINLASLEYFKAARAKQMQTRVIQCVFEDWKQGEDDGNVVGFLAKYARGRMARFIVENRIERAADLRTFDCERYRFRAQRSTDDTWIFGRRFIPVQNRD